VLEAINQLEIRGIVRQDKKIENANDILFTLYIESMTANVLIRAAFELANAEKIFSEGENREPYG
jgi:hypothetical protein